MFQKSVLILVVLLYLYEVQRTKKVTTKDAAMLLFFAYQLYQTFFLRVEHLSAADGFTTDIDKEAYTNLHKIVSELYKNDTLTIPGHLHVKGNLHVGDKAPSAIKAKNPNSGHTHIQGNLQVGDKGYVTDSGSTLTQGAIYGDYVRTRHVEANAKINENQLKIGKSGTDYAKDFVLTLNAKNIYSGKRWEPIEFHMVPTIHSPLDLRADLTVHGHTIKMNLPDRDGKNHRWKTLRGNGNSMWLHG
jgi:hypothetical protein